MSVSIGEYVRQCVLENSDLKNQEILDKVLEKFPQAKTTLACIAWYKTDMRKKGLIKPRNQPTLTSVNLEIETLQARLKVLEELKAKLEEDQLVQVLTELKDRPDIVEELNAMAKPKEVEA